jgi:hypothetical protein
MAAITVPLAYEGIPGIAHGGYTAGLLAEHLDGHARVMLRRPPLRDVPLTVEQADDVVLLRDGDGQLVMEAHAAEPIEVRLPAITIEEASARPRNPKFDHHPYPTCFVCGTARHDGLHIHLSAPDDDHIVTGVWTPSGPLLDGYASVPSPIVWAIVDCLTAWSFADRWDEPQWWPAVTGQISVAVSADIPLGQPCVLVARTARREGRRIMLEAGIVNAAGSWQARGTAVWVAVPAAPGLA